MPQNPVINAGQRISCRSAGSHEIHLRELLAISSPMRHMFVTAPSLRGIGALGGLSNTSELVAGADNTLAG